MFVSLFWDKRVKVIKDVALLADIFSVHTFPKSVESESRRFLDNGRLQRAVPRLCENFARNFREIPERFNVSEILSSSIHSNILLRLEWHKAYCWELSAVLSRVPARLLSPGPWSEPARVQPPPAPRATPARPTPQIFDPPGRSSMLTQSEYYCR